MFTRQSYQLGSFRKVKRRKGPPVWEFRYRDKRIPGHPQRQVTLSSVEFPTEAGARRHMESLLFKLNSNMPGDEVKELTFGALLDLFIENEHLKEISALKPGQSNVFGTLKVSSARGYLQIVENRIRPRWGITPISRVKPSGVDEWLRNMGGSPVTKTHIKALMSRLFNKAMLWELTPVQVNPMSLVKIRGASKRSRRPLVLELQQCEQLLDHLHQPYRTMALVGLCTGLRVNEILALKWNDVDFAHFLLNVSRGVVRGIVDQVKTEYSYDELPLDPGFALQLGEWETEMPRDCGGMDVPKSGNEPAVRARNNSAEAASSCRSTAWLRKRGLAHFATYVPIFARCGGRANRSAAKADAARSSFDNNESLRHGANEREAKGEHERC
jgi:integrase